MFLSNLLSNSLLLYSSNVASQLIAREVLVIKLSEWILLRTMIEVDKPLPLELNQVLRKRC